MEDLEEIKTIVSDAKKEIIASSDAKIKDATKELATKAQIEADKQETAAKLVTLGNQFDELAAKVEKGGKGGASENYLEVYRSKMKDDLAAIDKAVADGETVSSKLKPREFEVPLDAAKATMTYSASLSASQIFLTSAEMDNETYRAPKNPNVILDLISVVFSKAATFYTRYRATTTGAPAMVAEGGAFPNEQLNYVEESWKPKKIGVHADISAELLEDSEYLANELPLELTEDVKILLNTQVFTGDGTGNNLTGLKTVATAFTKPAGLTALVAATKFDVIRATYTLLRKNNFAVDKSKVAIVLNPTDMLDMDVKKDSTGQYILPPFMSAENMRIKGIPVIEDNNMTAGDFFMGDFKQCKLRMKRALTYEMFTKDAQNAKNDLFTATASLRATLVCTFPARKAFITGTFSTAITALQT